MKEYKKRIADKLPEYRLEEVGAVLIEGPKWCGKTTTAEQQAKSVLYMADPDNQNNYLEMAELNPQRRESSTNRCITIYYIDRLKSY